MNVYTAAQMREQERLAVERGTTYEQLMENAGQAAAADILRRHPKSGRALFACGKGNNGGDGLVIARVLQQHGWQSDIWLVLGDQLSELAALNLARLRPLPGIRLLTQAPDNDYQLVVDGLFGTGFTGTMPPKATAACRLLNNLTGEKIALDIPSGLNGDSGEADRDTFRADITYAFAAHKPAHRQPAARRHCGHIECLDIGIE